MPAKMAGKWRIRKIAELFSINAILQKLTLLRFKHMKSIALCPQRT
jgi:hypothetical protein